MVRARHAWKGQSDAETFERGDTELPERAVGVHGVEVVGVEEDRLALHRACGGAVASGFAPDRVRILPEVRIPEVDGQRVRHRLLPPRRPLAAADSAMSATLVPAR
jgi:hypothetical protein